MDDVRRAIANPAILAYVGSGLSDASIAAAPLAENAGLAYLATYASSPAILDPPRRAVFVVPPTYAAVAAAVGDEIVRAHLRRVALLHVAGSFGDVVAQAVRARVEAGGGEIVADESFPLAASAVDAQLARIRKARPDAVAFAGTPTSAAMIVREAAGTLAARLYDAGGAIASPAFLADVGTLADGVTGTAIVDPTPRTQPATSLRDAYREATGSAALPDAAAFSYEAVLAVASAISSGARDRATLPAYLHRLQLSDTGLGPLRFDADGARLGGRIWIVRVRAGGLAVIGGYVQTGARDVERVGRERAARRRGGLSPPRAARPAGPREGGGGARAGAERWCRVSGPRTAALRRLRERRRARDEAALADVGVALARHAPALRAACVAGFVGVRGEPPTLPLLDALRARGSRVLLPRLLDDMDLAFVEYAGREALGAGPRGLLEPVGPPLETAAIGSAEVVLVPALAVDRRGHRLGQGGGSYDRALPRAHGLRIAVVFADEVLDEVPVEPHDAAVDGVLTEHGLVRFRP